MYDMQNKSVDWFMYLLDFASVFEMPKLLACCEHHICIDPKQRFQPMRSSSQHLLPTSSALRIAKGLRMAFQRIGNRPCSSSVNSQLCCRCTGCESFRLRYLSGADTTKCICLCLSRYVPRPKEFLAMAHVESLSKGAGRTQ